jgi:hypothetical protein
MKRFNLQNIFTYTLLLLVCISHLRAQEYLPFPQDSAVWYLVRSYQWPHPPYIYFDTWKFEIQGDTLINDKVYKKVMYSVNESPHYNYFGAYRVEDEGKKVYYLDDYMGYEIIAYDYSLSKYDTIQINGADFICIDTGMIQLNNGISSRYQVMQVPLANDCIQIWVEGIGSLNFPLVETLYHCGYTFELDFNLTCFFYKDEKLYEWSDNPFFQGCFGFNTGIDDISHANLIAINPNPVTDLSRLVCNLSNTTLIDYKIYDIHGCVVTEEFDKYCHEIAIDKRSFSKGVYVFKYYLQNNSRFYSIKFIII